MDALNEIHEFLACETPPQWIEHALENQDILLIDHAHCEKKAASTAMTLMFRYVDRTDLLNKMSRLAREELIHFEQVLELLQTRGVEYCHLSSSGYAGGMRKHIRNHEPARLIDTMIVGAFIEARSCERFAKLAPRLDEVLAKFYRSLLKSECRHYQDYLSLAEVYAGEPIEDRIALFREVEGRLIESEDEVFRFHSGIPPKA
ncbi:tRNA-(ms[2]io[6]A)-hydroxylase [Neptunomonas qingdaonensis]|uniref:tRNA-(Ms[2]io[6]A)-hydroxylase n=1 Tax=Neptunomonas qingdaonensis TaxID=1045558 RepID=A0A1I2R8L7_9GAMM|nr:tRNA isopentenyl-2-thiomethyl-A-37 hydroxylase MiaE [Neptunomonas qingdaonensis]SFG34116.1 tRNA-(ms[2]io[6]A)-hydroxylase [Neptunomonas qingdaonensis]